MTLLIRFILISIIIYLLIRSFARYFEEQSSSAREQGNYKEKKTKEKGVSKEVGEYVDYEEVD
jgi:large-conductance mechanosensitive channel